MPRAIQVRLLPFEINEIGLEFVKHVDPSFSHKRKRWKIPVVHLSLMKRELLPLQNWHGEVLGSELGQEVIPGVVLGDARCSVDIPHRPKQVEG